MPRISFERWPSDHRSAGRHAFIAATLLAVGALVSGWQGFDLCRLRLQKRGFTMGEQDATKLHSILLQSRSMEIANLGHLPSSEAVTPALMADGFPTMSIASDPRNLTSDRDGIFEHPLERGRKWERNATVSYFENGLLRYETPVGIRVHGGKSRKGPVKSLQLVFRRSYAGSPRSAPGVFFEGTSDAYLRLVVSNTMKVQRFLNPLALDIAQRAGCITSKSQPARLVINGRVVPCGYFLLEHQSREFLQARFGHDDFEWIRLKGEHRPSPGFDELVGWVKRSEAPLTMRALRQRFDVDDLCAWVCAIALCGTTDNDQGAFFRDRKSENAPWRCLAWDMDGSFEHGDDVREGPVRFERVKGLRFRMFNRLCIEDPEFCGYFREFARRFLEEQFSEPEREKLILKYRAIARTEPFERDADKTLRCLDNTHAYLNKRASRFLADFDKYVAAQIAKERQRRITRK